VATRSYPTIPAKAKSEMHTLNLKVASLAKDSARFCASALVVTVKDYIIIILI
jgi:hypothetical protein